MIPVTEMALEDGKALARALTCSMWIAFIVERPATDEEWVAGLQTYVHDDHDHTISIGWRRRWEGARAEFRREAEMAACPYVECNCGHHEE